MSIQNAPPRESVAESQAAAQEEFSGYWFRLPAELDRLMALSNAELRAYIVAQHAIQRDRNRGQLSVRKMAERARLSPQHACKAAQALPSKGYLIAQKSPGKTTVYSSPVRWKDRADHSPTGEQYGQEATTRCSPPGEQLGRQGEQQCSPSGAQNHSPTGEQHSECKDQSRLRSKGT